VRLPHPHAILAHINPAQLQNWATIPTANGFAIPIGMEALRLDQVAATTTSIWNMLADFGPALNIQVAPPNPSNKAKAQRAQPLVMLVHGMPQDGEHAVIKKGFLANVTTGITFLFHPLVMARPTLALMMQGLITSNPGVAKTIVTNRLLDFEVLQTFGAQCNSLYEQSVTDGSTPLTLETYVNVVETIEVEPMNLIVNWTEVTRFNITVNSNLFAQEQHWAIFCKFIQSLTYPSNLYGTGYPMNPYDCKLCHSIAHPTGKCPLPQMAHWHGPTANRNQGRRNGDTLPTQGRDTRDLSGQGFPAGCGSKGGRRGYLQGQGSRGRRRGGFSPSLGRGRSQSLSVHTYIQWAELNDITYTCELHDTRPIHVPDWDIQERSREAALCRGTKTRTIVSRYGLAEGAPGRAAGCGTTGGARSLVRGNGECRTPST
jgi:hypothetical protein